MVEAADGVLESKCEAISALFGYAILERGQQQQMANAISHALQALDRRRGYVWDLVDPYTPILFCGPNTPSMDWLIILLSPYIFWDDKCRNKSYVIKWAAAASAVPYTEEVGRDVVSALLQIACYDSLRPHIPVEIWTWLKKPLTLPPLYRRRGIKTTRNTVHYIRGLGDIEIFKSFFILSWLEHNDVDDKDNMENLLREDFCGIGMWGHRKDLIKRLDRVLEGYRNRSDENSDSYVSRVIIFLWVC